MGRLAWCFMLAVALLTASCSTAGENEEAEPELGATGDQLIVVTTGACPDVADSCRGSLDDGAVGDGSLAVVVLDGDNRVYETVAADQTLAERVDLYVAGSPPADDRVLSTALEAGATATFVPADLASGLDHEALTMLLAADDGIAAFEVRATSGGAALRVVVEVLAERVTAARGLGSSEPAPTAQPAAPEPIIRWELEIGENPPLAVHNRAAVSSGIVAFVTYPGALHGVDQRSGQVRWRHELSPEPGPLMPIGTALAAGDARFYVGWGAPATGGSEEVAGALAAFDAISGDVVWRLEDPVGFSHAAFGDGRVYAARASDDTLVAVDAATGEERWIAPLGASLAVPVFESGSLWIGTIEGHLAAFEAETGTETFRFEGAASPLGLGGVASPPGFVDALAVFGSDDGVLHAVDRGTGEETWRVTTDDLNLPAGPLIVGDMAVAATMDGHIYGIDVATGNRRWRAELGPSISTPALVDDVVVVATMERGVLGLEPSTGAVRWALAAPGGVTASPVVDDGLVFIQVPGRFLAIDALSP